jgi:heat shock protein HtpX
MGSKLLVVRNLFKVWGLLFALCALLGGIGWVLNGYSLFSIFVFSGLLIGAGVYWYADRAVLGLVGARELPQGEAPGLHSTVERLAALAGVFKPRLFLIPDGLPRACSAGRGPRGSTIVVSTGLLQALPPAELEAALAHELAHIRHRDAFVESVAVVIAAVIVESSRIGGWFRRALLFVLGPVAAAFVHLLLSPKREFDADRAAAAICGTPHGLAAALLRLDQASELVAFRGSPVTEPLYTINPFEVEGLAALFVTHPPVAERVRRLWALDPEGRSGLRAA